MICDGNCFMSPVISTLYKHFGICHTIHITHFCMAVQFHSFLRAGIHSGRGKICNLPDSCHGTNGQLTVKPVNGGYTFELQKSSFFYISGYIRNLLVFKEHFDHNTVCKICYRKDQNRLFITDLPFFHIKNLSSYDDFSHFSRNAFQRNRFSFKIPSID